MKKRNMPAFIIAAGLGLTVMVPQTASASDFQSEYSITILGLSVGKVGFKTTIKDGNYKLTGSMSAAGVAKLFTSTSGNLKASGRYSNGKVTPVSYSINYKEGKKSKSTTMAFNKAGVSKYSNSPKVRKNGKWVELQKAHLKSALDPITATLVLAKDLRSVCQNTLKIFDGAMRADFPMRYVRTIPFSTTGYKGDAVTCRAQFKPISGYDSNKNEVKWMRDKGYADVSFAPVGNTGLYAPVVAKIKTQIGTATIRARRFESLIN